MDYVEDELSGLMNASMTEQSASPENHCAIETEVCLSERLLDHRVVDEDCKGGDEAGEGVLNRLRESNYVDRGCRQRTSADERLRGHPHFFFILPFGYFVCVPFGQSRSRGGACFCRMQCSSI